MLLKKLTIILNIIILMTPFLKGQEIFDALQLGDSNKVKSILKEQPLQINQRNNLEQTPLLFSVATRNYEMAKLLIKNGALVNVGDNNLRAPIHFANWNSDIKMIELLLANGAVIDTRAIGGATPLIHSSLNNDFEMSKYLIEKGADIQIQCNALTTPLYFAVLNNNINYVNYLINAGAEINVPDFLDRTPLFIAVRDGNKAIAETLLQNGADVYRKDKYLNRSLLHIAAIEGHNDIIEMLFQKGLDVNEKDENGYSPLDYAIRYGHTSTIKLLKEKGALSLTEEMRDNIIQLNNLEMGEAEIIKLQNGGWGINTKNNFFIFGYSEIGTEPLEKSLLNGYISLEQFRKDKNIVCINHDYQPAGSTFSVTGFNPLLPGKNTAENITYIFNFRNDRRYTQKENIKMFFPKPEETIKVNDFNVTILSSYKTNLVYIFELDGLIIVWITGICDNYQLTKRNISAINELNNKKIKPDILLLGSPSGIGPEVAHGIRETYLEAMKLDATSVFIFGHEPLERKVFYQVERKITSKPENIFCAGNPGDRFVFKQGKINDN